VAGIRPKAGYAEPAKNERVDMPSPLVVEIEIPAGWESFRLPEGLHRRLQHLLDKQDAGGTLSDNEREEAQGLVDLSEWLSLLRQQAKRVIGDSHVGITHHGLT
jgi:hypothetical protein